MEQSIYARKGIQHGVLKQQNDATPLFKSSRSKIVFYQFITFQGSILSKKHMNQKVKPETCTPEFTSPAPASQKRSSSTN